jgi:hypothetical protein
MRRLHTWHLTAPKVNSTIAFCKKQIPRYDGATDVVCMHYCSVWRFFWDIPCTMQLNTDPVRSLNLADW